MARAERGAALLEVLVALAILSGAGVAVVGLLGAGLRAQHEAREREQRLAAAERVLTSMTLLTRSDLDRRLGRHPIGEFVVDVQRPEPTLYRVAIAEAASAHVEELVPVVYRREEHAR
jgi:type II secretory pathway pseudopilin PulG